MRKGGADISVLEWIGRKMTDLLRLYREILIPRTCRGCGMEIGEGLLCGDCRESAAWKGGLPELCRQTVPVSCFVYEGAVRDALHRIKFQRDERTAVSLSREIHLLLEKHGAPAWLADPDLIWCGIPTDPRRKRARGFDLPTVLFRPLAERNGAVWTPLLTRKRNTAPMSRLSPGERRRNIRGCFGLRRNVRGKRIVLTDDIFTTGATLEEAFRVLKLGGAEEIRILTACSSPENRQQ